MIYVKFILVGIILIIGIEIVCWFDNSIVMEILVKSVTDGYYNIKY